MDKVAVIGMGYVGIPLVAALSNVGYKVVGLDIDKKRIKNLIKFKLPIYEPGVKETLERNKEHITFSTDYSALKDAKAILVTVGTPIDKGQIIFKYLYAAVSGIAQNMAMGTSIILKSTVKIGTTRIVEKLMREGCDYKLDKDYYLAFCPERTIEGLALHELYTLPKIVGGMSGRSTDICSEIISKLGGKIIKVSKPEVAELSKLVDNYYRAANIAFINELAEFCEMSDINCHEMISAVNNAYSRTHIFSPGLGADGPCLIKDPTILMTSMNKKDTLIKKVIDVNKYSTDRIFNIVTTYFKDEKKLDTALIGMAFKGFPETDDIRSSPSLRIKELLEKYYSNKCELYDPLVKRVGGTKVNKDLKESIYNKQCVIFLNNHPSYKGMEIHLDKFKKRTLVIDCWDLLKIVGSNPKVKVYTIGRGYQ